MQQQSIVAINALEISNDGFSPLQTEPSGSLTTRRLLTKNSWTNGRHTRA